MPMSHVKILEIESRLTSSERIDRGSEDFVVPFRSSESPKKSIDVLDPDSLETLTRWGRCENGGSEVDIRSPPHKRPL